MWRFFFSLSPDCISCWILARTGSSLGNRGESRLLSLLLPLLLLVPTFVMHRWMGWHKLYGMLWWIWIQTLRNRFYFCLCSNSPTSFTLLLASVRSSLWSLHTSALLAGLVFAGRSWCSVFAFLLRLLLLVCLSCDGSIVYYRYHFVELFAFCMLYRMRRLYLHSYIMT